MEIESNSEGQHTERVDFKLFREIDRPRIKKPVAAAVVVFSPTRDDL